MKDRPVRKCTLATDQVIHATHDPYILHKYTRILRQNADSLVCWGAFEHELWTSSYIKLHLNAFELLPAESLSHQQYVLYKPHLGIQKGLFICGGLPEVLSNVIALNT